MKRILVVEDEPLIGLYLAEELEAAGFAVVGPASCAWEGLDLLVGQGCDAAVLDINLGKESSEPIAQELLRREIPFVTLSGYSEMQQAPVFRGAPALAKPVVMERLIAQIHQLLPAA